MLEILESPNTLGSDLRVEVVSQSGSDKSTGCWLPDPIFGVDVSDRILAKLCSDWTSRAGISYRWGHLFIVSIDGSS